MIYLNNVTALAACALMMLVFRGYIPFVRLGCDSAASMSRLGVFLCSFAVLIRMMWWDLMRPTLGALGYMPNIRYEGFGIYANAMFNVLIGGAALLLLGALHRSIPARDRGNYNWITAVRYPKRWRLRVFARPE